MNTVKQRYSARSSGDIPTLDFSGWPMVVHSAMAEEVAYALCEAIDKRKALMPTDNF